MRLIDADKIFPDVIKVDGSVAISQGQLAHAKTVEAIPKSDYENRLKADMVAMLIELKKEIEQLEMGNNVPFGFEPVNKFYEGVSASSKVVQQKIDVFREVLEDGK